MDADARNEGMRGGGSGVKLTHHQLDAVGRGRAAHAPQLHLPSAPVEDSLSAGGGAAARLSASRLTPEWKPEWKPVMRKCSRTIWPRRIMQTRTALGGGCHHVIIRLEPPGQCRNN